MKNKRTITFVSALLILVFHLWINVTSLVEESIIRQLFIIGVDLFIFISGYNISKHKDINYKDFILNRFCDVYLKFVIFTIIYVIYKDLDFNSFIKIILGIDLFNLGGGAFLWFIPSIMIIYLILPIYKIIDNKYKIVPFITFIFYIISVIIISNSDYYYLTIILNRLPILFLGYYFEKYKLFDRCKGIVFIFMFIIGLFISYYFINNNIIINWFNDINYVVNIILEIGLIYLLSLIKENKITKLIGNSSLELYGIQMIFGFKITNIILKNINNNLITNIIVIVVMIVISVLLNLLLNFILKYINKYVFRIS